MRRIDLTIATFATLALGVAGCTVGNDDGDSTAETRQSAQLLEGEVEGEEGTTAPAAFGYDADKGWHFQIDDGAFPSDSVYRTISQGAGHDAGSFTDAGGGNAHGGGGGSGGGTFSGASNASMGPSFSGASSATVNFSGGGPQVNRYSASSRGNVRYSGTSSATVRFTGSASVSFSGQCRPTALCDLAESACQVSNGTSGASYTEGCSQSAIQQCRTDVRRAFSQASSSGKAFICLFAVFAECANQGLERAGSVTTSEQYNRAVARGLRGCFQESSSSGSGSFEFETSF